MTKPDNMIGLAGIFFKSGTDILPADTFYRVTGISIRAAVNRIPTADGVLNGTAIKAAIT